MFNGRRSLETRFSPVTRHVKTRFLTVMLELGSPLVSGVNEHLSIKSAGLVSKVQLIPK
jgi:hypothetical protein